MYTLHPDKLHGVAKVLGVKPPESPLVSASPISTPAGNLVENLAAHLYAKRQTG